MMGNIFSSSQVQFTQKIEKPVAVANAVDCDRMFFSRANLNQIDLDQIDLDQIDLDQIDLDQIDLDLIDLD